MKSIMRLTSNIFLAFLLILYIIPMFLVPSYSHAAITAGPNMSKDFSPSTYGDVSSQSITSFSETLPDDTLFFPDEIDFDMSTCLIDGNVTGGTETNDYTYMISNDASNWRGSSSGSTLYLYFDVSGSFPNTIKVYYDALSSSAGSDHISLYLYNPLGSDLLIASNTNASFDAIISGHSTVNNMQNYMYGNIYTFYFYTTYKAPVTVIDADYFDIRITTLKSSENYAESFSDVSSWTIETGSLTSNGDTADFDSVYWLTGWDHRKEISITGSSGAGTNYQIPIQVTYDSDMKTDFGDIRFTTDDKETELDYWLESYVTSTSAYFWVEVTANLSTDQEIYMYYGNSTVSTTSNGENTFLFYEDWSTQSIESDKWDTSGTATITYSAVDATHGYVQKQDVTTSNTEYFQSTDLHVSAPVAIVARIKLAHTLADYQRLYFGSGHVGASEYPAAFVGNTPTGTYHIVYDDAGNPLTYSIGDTYVGSYQRFEIRRDGTNSYLYNYTTLVSTLDITPDTNSRPIIGTYCRDSEYDLFTDWMFGRKFIAIEPEVSTIGSEVSVSGTNGPCKAYFSFSATDYFEFYYEFFVTDLTSNYTFQFYYSSSWVNVTDLADTEGTISGILSNANANAITRFGFLVDGGNLTVDYLRIMKYNERGWQHDGSTIEGITNLSDMTIATNDGLLTFTATGGSFGSARINFDTTSIKSNLSVNYYQFLRVNVSGNTALYKISITWSNGTSTDLHNYQTYTGIFRYNLRALSDLDIDYITIFVSFYGGKTTTFDFIKAYSIANFTYTGIGVSLDDVLYVENNILQCSGTSFTSMILDYDPALSVTSPYSVWDMNTSLGTPQVDFYSGAWLGYTSETSGLITDTLTDVRIKFTDSANIISIKFTDTHMWQDVNGVTVYIIGPIDYWALNMFLVLFGLALVVVCACLMAYSIRNRNISRDRFFWLFVLFMVGWGIFLGGALIG